MAKVIFEKLHVPAPSPPPVRSAREPTQGLTPHPSEAHGLHKTTKGKKNDVLNEADRLFLSQCAAACLKDGLPAQLGSYSGMGGAAAARTVTVTSQVNAQTIIHHKHARLI